MVSDCGLLEVSLNTGELKLRKPISELEAKAFAAFRKEKAHLLEPVSGTDDHKIRYMRSLTESIRAFVTDYRKGNS